MAEEDKKQGGKGFTVQDRRRFSPETGETREGSPESKDIPHKEAEENQTEQAQMREANQQSLPEINFSTFVISLSTQALMHLGEIVSPLSGKVETDYPVAKQMIDILGMLEEKTRGNLNPSEGNLIGDILFDLRMKYVEAMKKK